ncbi:RESPONSE REGULATOR PROTEIN-CheY-like nd an HD-GYP domain [hydrothermal vent metagenome]|uniref:RESPONSE REGULATOR PROTEIN-CheY-like nd an HD-GYP domain n=1 Tax=hydrothermal vent metagenome TaxID=652676 RepID=A0A3B1E6I7_9ZZZZ
MGIKQIIKTSFLLIGVVVILMSSLSILVLYQIKDDDISKKNIFKLVLLQEDMDILIKDLMSTKNLNGIKEMSLNFNKRELAFEDVKNIIQLNYQDDFINYFIQDLHKEKIINKSLQELFDNEIKIKKFYKKVYDLQKEKIKNKNLFNKIYPIEKKEREYMEKIILSKDDIVMVREFGYLQYYSKETLYQYRNKKALNNWLHQIDLLQNKYNMIELKKYKLTVDKIASYAIAINKIERQHKDLQDSIAHIINNNKTVSTNIEKNIDTLFSGFISKVFIVLLILCIVTIIGLVLIGFRVYKNVGLSVDQIESKVQDGLKKINNLNQEITTTQKEVVFTMGSIGESRSKETGNHVKRVAEYSKILALHYGLSKDEVEMLKQASPMHDIGKVAIPDDILKKPGRLDDNEREIMNTHVQLGFEMLKTSTRPLLKLAAIVSYQHHEKWDGSGYPQGLKGEDIDINGRITALADVFDALGSSRVYKKAWDDEKIFKFFKDERAKHFDPKLVDIFFDNLDEFLLVRDKFKDII